MKNLVCARCGEDLELIRKAHPGTGALLNMVVPHECSKVTSREDLDLRSIEVKKGSLPFVEKINEAQRQFPMLPDRRPREHVRKEIESTAPTGLHDYIKGLGGATPPMKGRDLEEPDEGFHSE